ncbi:MAG: NAD-dependent epimerase/dehydratase family protein [Myxococcota bacterium]
MKVAIWGATDFVGGAIARVIGATGYTLRLMGPPHTLSTNPPGRRVEQRIAPMADRHALERALAGQDVLIYAEPYRPRTHMPRDTALHEGVDRIRTLLSAARKAGVAHTIYLGSAITVGRPPSEGKRLTELDLYMPGQRDDDPWFDVAYAMECEVLAANSYTMHTSALMYTTPIGPGRALPAPIMAMVQGRLPLIWDGRCNVIDVRALAGTAFQAIRLARAGHRYLLAAHSPCLTPVSINNCSSNRDKS